jgi:hypothetical protein
MFEEGDGRFEMALASRQAFNIVVALKKPSADVIKAPDISSGPGSHTADPTFKRYKQAQIP